MNGFTKAILWLSSAALRMKHAFAANTTEVNMTCDSEKPVIMLVARRTLNAEHMRDYAIALSSSNLYAAA